MLRAWPASPVAVSPDGSACYIPALPGGKREKQGVLHDHGSRRWSRWARECARPLGFGKLDRAGAAEGRQPSASSVVTLGEDVQGGGLGDIRTDGRGTAGRGASPMNESGSGLPGVQRIPVGSLLLDGENPRLPERLHGASQSELLDFLYEQGVLEELAQSYLDNGFFQHEPLIVLPTGEQGKYTVVEGNRRLAALKILHGDPEAGEFHFLGMDPSPVQLAGLREIPCFPISSREEVRAYIGFRHIGGLKTWPSEAKARYLLAEVRKLVELGVADPFRELGRRVGSNVQGIRNPYLAIRILLHAREEFGLEVTHVQEDRFGIWLRCMNSADIRAYIGLCGARTHQEIEEALKDIQGDRLAEVLGDLKSAGGRALAVLGDSRDVTAYGRVLENERARATLRKTGDLSLAKQVVEELGLEERAWRLTDSVKHFVDTLHRVEPEEIPGDLREATKDLANVSRSARDIVRGRIEDERA